MKRRILQHSLQDTNIIKSLVFCFFLTAGKTNNLDNARHPFADKRNQLVAFRAALFSFVFVAVKTQQCRSVSVSLIEKNVEAMASSRTNSGQTTLLPNGTTRRL